MRYSHRFLVRAPLAKVADFHRRSSSLSLLTPPPAGLRIMESPAFLGDGDVMRFSIGLGPGRVEWLARIEDVSESGFADRQLAGPFATWVHRHRFTALDAETTEVHDEVTAEMKPGLPFGPLGHVIWIGLPALFAYRAFQTRRILRDRA